MPRKVLIVDDQADIRDIARVGLELTTDWEVQVAASGEEALEIASRERPDAILLDVMMPHMDGPTAVRALRANPETLDIPVILLTARMLSEDGGDLAELAVSGLLSKPFDPMSLADSVSTLLGWAA
jgi:CheY-like chemotaxis protein